MRCLHALRLVDMTKGGGNARDDREEGILEMTKDVRDGNNKKKYQPKKLTYYDKERNH